MRVVALALAGLSLMSCLVFAWSRNRQQSPAQHERPRKVNSGRVTTLRARGDLQAALDAAQAGDTIELEAGATFAGSFTLPRKNGDAYITIRSSQINALPREGERVSPTNAALMPKLVSRGKGEPALRTAAGAHHYRFVGVEFAPADASAMLYHVIALGDVGAAQDTLEEVPHHLIFDRCYIHAFPSQELRRGIMLNSAATEIVNCYISDFKAKGADAQAIAGWNGPGPFRIVNNYLEGSGENIMFGGSDPSIPNLVPSDIEVCGNLLTKPLAWRGVWSVKNLFELKNARRVVVDGNVMENNWGDAQSGEAILFTVRNQDGGAPWSVVEDVQFTNNVVRHAGGGVNILGHDYYHPSEQAKRLVVRNNFFDDISDKWNGKGEFLLMSQRAADVTVDHNTVRHTGSVAIASEGPHTGFVFTNNLLAHNEYGIHGDGTGSGNQTFQKYFPGAVVRRNLIAGAQASNYPVDNFYPASLDAAAGFVDLSVGNYRLRAESRYHARGTDGKDVGCDFDALEAAHLSSPR